MVRRLFTPIEPLEAPCENCGQTYLLRTLQPYKMLNHVCDECRITLKELWNAKLDVNNFEVKFTYTMNSQEWFIGSNYDKNGEMDLTNEDVKEMLLEDLKNNINGLDLNEIISYCTFKKLV